MTLIQGWTWSVALLVAVLGLFDLCTALVVACRLDATAVMSVPWVVWCIRGVGCLAVGWAWPRNTVRSAVVLMAISAPSAGSALFLSPFPLEVRGRATLWTALAVIALGRLLTRPNR